MNTLRLYARSMAILIKSQLQYPLSFLMQTIAQLVMEGGEMLALILLIQAAWILILTGAGMFFWNRNQKRIVIQGG